MRACIILAAATASFSVAAQTPPILLEACNAMEPASKRLECLRAASGVSTASVGSSRSAPVPQALFSPPKSTSRTSVVPGSSYSIRGRTCYVGPRGGTYTITASGRKDYSGC